VIKTQTKVKVMTTLLWSAKYFKSTGIVQHRTAADHEELNVGTDFKTTVWNTALPGSRHNHHHHHHHHHHQAAVEQQWESGERDSSLQYLSDQYLAGSSLRDVSPSSSSSSDGGGSGGSGGSGLGGIDSSTQSLLLGDNDEEELDHDDDDDKDVVMKDAKQQQPEKEEEEEEEEVAATVSLSSSWEVVELDCFNRNITMEYFVHFIDVMNAKNNGSNNNNNNNNNEDDVWSMENESHPDNTFRAKHQHRTFPVAKHPNAPPAWMLNLRAIIVNQALSMSARLFALKIVMHRPTVFAPFAVSLVFVVCMWALWAGLF